MNQNNQKKYQTSFITLLFFSISLKILHCFFFIYYLLYSFSECLFQNLLLSLQFFFSVSLGIIYCFIFIYYLLYSFSFSEYLFQNLVLSLCFSPFLWVYATVSSYLLSWNSFSEYLFQKLFLQVSLSLFVTHCLSIAPIILYLLPNFTNRVPLFYLGKFYRLCNVLQLPKHPS